MTATANPSGTSAPDSAIDRSRLRALLAREKARFAAEHPLSLAAHQAGREHLFGGVPMTWMNKAAGGFPLQVATARGAHVTDVDGREYVDFALGDTGAMAGHSPAATVAAVRRRLEDLGGAAMMMPTEDAAAVGAELSRRFGSRVWSFSLTATDANRWVLRMARQVTGRPRILVASYSYHGTVDETFVTLGPDGPVSRAGNVGAAVDPTTTTRVVEFNDVAALERELSYGDVAAVLMEPALTNIGIVLPDPGYHEALRRLCTQNGALLVIDETHTLSAGPGGCTAAWSLDPDVVTIGKSIGGGIPIGAYGLTRSLAERIEADEGSDLVDVGGVGGTLAGNALSLAAARATLADVLTEEAFAFMTARATRFTAGVQGVIDRYDVPWSVVQLGARAEYRFATPAPRTGGASAAAADAELEDYLHVRLANSGVLLTPFHNMALMCPATTDADVDRHTAAFEAAVAELFTH
ncbi:MAG: glutamate-semialdehyde -aminomutase [Frankiaceae bacterium]|nr:glutamate-semialdehyde -aminomutase [Frankiaceae bacterium]